jgi:17beta-estradiol 17-dehydrogenase / very-long-chain 3-oxoacyl-CoA reductase
MHPSDHLICMQAPFFVATRMVENLAEARRLSPFTVTPGAYARAAVGWIGRGGPLCTPNVRHRLLWCAAAAAPDSVLDWFLLRSHLEQRTTLSQQIRASGAPAPS